MEFFEFFLRYGYLIWMVWVFLLGAGIGSWLNVCVARLPLEKSVIWPGSRCGSCLRSIAWYDNLPLYSYLRLGGQCRRCGSRFSVRYFLIELFTGAAFAALFYFSIVENQLGFTLFERKAFAIRSFAEVPWQAWVLFLQQATLVSLLIAASACDLDRREIPLALTTVGTVIGLTFSTLCPWPWPNHPSAIPNELLTGQAWFPLALRGEIPIGMTPWPAWGPLPDWMPAGTWQCGLMTGLAGAAMGVFLLRAVAFIFGKAMGKEALGLGDADLMMMVGAFLGWQVVVIAFFAGALASLVIAVPRVLLGGDNALPLGPGLAVGTVFTLFAWPSFGPSVQFLFFDWVILALLLSFCLVFLLIAGLVLRGITPRTR